MKLKYDRVIRSYLYLLFELNGKDSCFRSNGESDQISIECTNLKKPIIYLQLRNFR